MANWSTIERLGNPADPEWQKKNLAWVEPMAGQRWQVYAPAAKAFEGLLGDLAAQGYPLKSSGGFNYRNMRGSNNLSQHAFGTAIDVNAGANPMLSRGAQVVTDLPANTAELAKKHGLVWGGNWKRPDAMHFEWAGDPSIGSQVASQEAAPPQPSGTPAPPMGEPINVGSKQQGGIMGAFAPAPQQQQQPSFMAGVDQIKDGNYLDGVSQMFGSMSAGGGQQQAPQAPAMQLAPVQGPSGQQATALANYVQALLGKKVSNG